MLSCAGELHKLTCRAQDRSAGKPGRPRRTCPSMVPYRRVCRKARNLKHVISRFWTKPLIAPERTGSSIKVSVPEQSGVLGLRCLMSRGSGFALGCLVEHVGTGYHLPKTNT